MAQGLGKYCNVSGEMQLVVTGPRDLAAETTEAEIKSGIFLKAAWLIEEHSNFNLSGANYIPKEGLTLYFKRIESHNG